MQYIFMGLGALLAVVAIMGLVVAVWYRRVVPTNMVHIVQSAKATVAYGRGKTSGNTYYAWPSCVPALGITVTEFPESIFQVSLVDYEAYDQARLPFTIDAVAFFRVSDAAVAAQRVSSFAELKNQLQAVLQGAVRRILATNTLEEIMQSWL
jgi:flotillin